MSDRKAEIEDWVPAVRDILASTWQLAPFDLSLPDNNGQMPDVKLEELCDIIFARLDLPPR